MKGMIVLNTLTGVIPTKPCRHGIRIYYVLDACIGLSLPTEYIFPYSGLW